MHGNYSCPVFFFCAMVFPYYQLATLEPVMPIFIFACGHVIFKSNGRIALTEPFACSLKRLNFYELEQITQYYLLYVLITFLTNAHVDRWPFNIWGGQRATGWQVRTSGTAANTG